LKLPPTIFAQHIAVTAAGMSAAKPMDAEGAIDRAKSGLSKRQAKFFDAICVAHPGAISRVDIASQFNIHPRGGSLGDDLHRLVDRGLVEGGRGGNYRAKDFLFG